MFGNKGFQLRGVEYSGRRSQGANATRPQCSAVLQALQWRISLQQAMQKAGDEGITGAGRVDSFHRVDADPPAAL